MKVFPAIDIKNGKCVRLVKGDFDNKTEYEMSPIDQAGKYKDHGFKNLHIVDLDGALTGETVNLEIIEEIVSQFNFKVEIGGGVRNFESIQKYADVGVEKVILGSAAIKETNFLKIAKNLGHRFENGKMMFLYQAHQAFTLWHKVMPDIDDETIRLFDK